MPRVIEKTVFKFDELNDRAKEKARDWWRQGCCQDWEPDFWEFEDCAKKLGIEFAKRKRQCQAPNIYDPDINYSVGDRGEFCVFAGSWTYRPEAVDDITADGWTDTTLLDIANELQRAWVAVAMAGGTTLTARMTTRSRGCSSMSMDIEPESDMPDVLDEDGFSEHGLIPQLAAETVGECMTDFAGWMLKQMSDDYEYQYSDECVDEALISNEYEFDEDGRRV